jgi:hypothetical protein
MNAKSLCWCLVALTISFRASANLAAQMVDDTGSKWRLEQVMRQEARLISSGKRIYDDKPPKDIVRGLHELTELQHRAAERDREDVLLRSKLAKPQEDLTKAREKVDAELKSTQAEKEEMARALANAKAELAKTIADKSAAFATLQKIIEERDDDINELKKEVNRLQDAQAAQEKKSDNEKKKSDKRERDLINQKELGIAVLVLVLVLVLVAVPWEMWISARLRRPSEDNNREGSSTRWMRIRAFFKRRWRWVAVPAAVAIWAIGAAVFSESRGTSLFRRSQHLLPGMNREQVFRTMGSAPAEELQRTAPLSLDEPETFPAVMLVWEDDRWYTFVFLNGEGRFVATHSRDINPPMLSRSFEWLHHQLNWSVTDKLWRWSL